MQRVSLSLLLALSAVACQPKKPQVAAVKEETTIGDRKVDLTNNANSGDADAVKMRAEITKRREAGMDLSYECWTAQSQKIIDHYKAKDLPRPMRKTSPSTS